MSEEIYYIDRLNHTKKMYFHYSCHFFLFLYSLFSSFVDFPSGSYETLKYHEISTISECVEKFSMIIGCNI